MSVQAESLGPAIDLSAGYETYWTYVGHFIHSPFYVYAYAFGDCLVNSLYGVYERAHEGFVERYFALLAAGGSKPYGELAEAVRAGRARPEILVDRPVADRADDRGTGGDGVVSLPQHRLLHANEVGDAAARQSQHLQQLLFGERRPFGGALHLDEAAGTGDHEIRVRLGNGILGVIEV